MIFGSLTNTRSSRISVIHVVGLGMIIGVVVSQLGVLRLNLVLGQK